MLRGSAEATYREPSPVVVATLQLHESVVLQEALYHDEVAVKTPDGRCRVVDADDIANLEKPRGLPAPRL